MPDYQRTRNCLGGSVGHYSIIVYGFIVLFLAAPLCGEMKAARGKPIGVPLVVLLRIWFQMLRAVEFDD
jgi:hypothetical protein